jgi:hypothetical protein
MNSVEWTYGTDLTEDDIDQMVNDVLHGDIRVREDSDSEEGSDSDSVIIFSDDDDIFTTREDPLPRRSEWDDTITLDQLQDLRPKQEDLDLTAFFGQLRTDGTLALDLHNPPDEADELIDDMYVAFAGIEYKVGKRSEEYTREQRSNLLRFSRDAAKFIRRGYHFKIIQTFATEFDDDKPKSARESRVRAFIKAIKYIPREALLHEDIPWRCLYRNVAKPSDTIV